MVVRLPSANHFFKGTNADEKNYAKECKRLLPIVEKVFQKWVNEIHPQNNEKFIYISVSQIPLPPSDDFIGIYPISVLDSVLDNKGRIGLLAIYRKAKGEFGWECAIYPSKESTVKELIIKTKVGNASFINSRINNLSPKMEQFFTEANRVSEALMQYDTIELFLVSLRNSITSDGLIHESVLRQKLVDFHKKSLRAITIDRCIAWLLDGGILNAIEENGNYKFKPMEYFFLLCYKYDIKEKENTQMKLNLELKRLFSKRDKALKAKKDFLEEAEKQSRIVDSLDIEINDISNKLTETND